MHKFITLVLLASMGILIAYGITAAESFASDLARLSPVTVVEKSIWLVAGSLVVAGTILFGLFRKTSAL